MARTGVSIRPRTSLYLAPGLILAAFSTICLLLALTITVSAHIWGETVTSAADPFVGGRSPIPCHSHNDYWRREPLFSALKAGCTGIEVDVWAYNNDLYAGHERGDLSPNRTLSDLYVKPLVEILRQENQSSLPGVYDMDSRQTLVLLIDIKSNPGRTWPLVLEKLEPLRKQGWLSYVKAETVVYGPITVVATGNSRLELVLENNSYRDVFLDAPLNCLEDGPYDRTNSYYASASLQRSVGRLLSSGLRESQLREVRKHVRSAHNRGLKARYWGLPAWPLELRNDVWAALIREGVDVLNVDDLASVQAVLRNNS